nr:uncharacterized protein LOC107411235 isoform X1 [Ziziphus jujuba var. spinosa]XP_048336210.1 uncharacterized protein LOC107411235 isoform X1 [Ziziphus jujuba var. spinosa]
MVFAYCGIFVVACWIAKLNTPFLLKALNDHPDYKVKIQAVRRKLSYGLLHICCGGMKELISKKSGEQVLLNSDISSNLVLVLSVELDLWLWSFSIQFPSLQHHRALSTYY